MERRLSTGYAPLDKVLGGGFRFGWVSLIYGEAATGKTTLAVKCVVNYLRASKSRAFYVDADGKLSPARLLQIAGGDPEPLERLLLWSPASFSEQTDVVEGLLDVLRDGSSPVVVDSVTGLYRVEADVQGRDFRASKELNRQLGFLAEVARARNAAVLLTGQVHSVPVEEAPRVEMVAQRILTYWSDVVLRLEHVGRSGVRQAVLEKPKVEDNVCRFRIGERGLEETERPW